MTTSMSEARLLSSTAHRIAQRFHSVYRENPRGIFRAPGRVNLIGEHTDYNDGFVMPAAIDFYTCAAISERADRTLSVYSEQFQETVEFNLNHRPESPRQHWSDYVRGVAAVLQDEGYPPRSLSSFVACERCAPEYESLYSLTMLRPKVLRLMAVVSLAPLIHASGAEREVAQPGLKEVQVPFRSLKPSATFKIGKTADWVLVTDDAVWVGGSKPYSVQRIDPSTNKIVAKIRLPGEACSGLAFGFGSVWVPVCGKRPSLARVDVNTNEISAVLPIGMAGAEGGITASSDSIWIVPDEKGTLTRIDPRSNTVRQRISIPPGSYNPIFSDGMIWITGVDKSVLTVVDASSGDVLASLPVGSKPRFLTSGYGSVWTLNQGDGTVTRVDTSTRKVTATIPVGIPGAGGDICSGGDSVWTAKFGVPLTRIDTKTNKVSRQWVGRGGDALRFGYDSIWLTDYHRGLLWRIPFERSYAESSGTTAGTGIVAASAPQNFPEAVPMDKEPHHHVLFKNFHPITSRSHTSHIRT